MEPLNIDVACLNNKELDYPYALEYEGPSLGYAVPIVEPLTLADNGGQAVKSTDIHIGPTVTSEKHLTPPNVFQVKSHLRKTAPASLGISSSFNGFLRRVLHRSVGRWKQKTACERPSNDTLFFKESFTSSFKEIPLSDEELLSAPSELTLFSKEELLSYTSFSGTEG